MLKKIQKQKKIEKKKNIEDNKNNRKSIVKKEKLTPNKNIKGAIKLSKLEKMATQRLGGNGRKSVLGRASTIVFTTEDEV